MVMKAKKRKTAQAPAEAAEAGDMDQSSVRAEDGSKDAPTEPFRELTREEFEARRREKLGLAANEDLTPATVGGEPSTGREGVLHLGSVPTAMKPEKLRHMMEQFGEVGRVYLQPEDKTDRQRRKKLGGNRKQRYTEGWVEFLDRKVARGVAEQLNGTTIGGKKRKNFFRDDLWNLKYLPKFKWHQLKEQTIYNQHVRKSRLEQKVSQAQRENTFFLEKVEQNKMQKRMAKRRGLDADDAQASGASTAATASKKGLPERKRPASDAPQMSGKAQVAENGGVISERILSSLF
eukprot:TRINITY_DN102664_c0_g1_i1.p1 TRINITY_DN102664_c0_g1~~TRINITY_DN102664_c0_g1_i1.p1  ORF type:complete len:291 (+),score=69.25 TRINITY_DN102664_c0_g1_i1:53-925(+)